VIPCRGERIGVAGRRSDGDAAPGQGFGRFGIAARVGQPGEVVQDGRDIGVAGRAVAFADEQRPAVGALSVIELPLYLPTIPSSLRATTSSTAYGPNVSSTSATARRRHPAAAG
jgi:hypothetical protein